MQWFLVQCWSLEGVTTACLRKQHSTNLLRKIEVTYMQIFMDLPHNLKIVFNIRHSHSACGSYSFQLLRQLNEYPLHYYIECSAILLSHTFHYFQLYTVKTSLAKQNWVRSCCTSVFLIMYFNHPPPALYHINK